MLVIDKEQYLAQNGASKLGLGEPALHKNKGRNSDKTWAKMVEAQAEKDRALIALRDELRAEYEAKVKAGEIRPPNRIERLIETAKSPIASEAVLAARRILDKNNIAWE
jgi:hypothetical protein